MQILRLGLLAGLCLSSCATPSIYSHSIYEDPTSFVRLEFSPTASIDHPETLHSHPAELTLDQLQQILSGLRVREHRSSVLLWFMDTAELRPAFGEKEIAFLSQHLGKALQQAVSEEVVTFYISTPVNSVKREVTSGALFVKDQEFHFMLSNHRTVYGIPPFGLVYDRQHPSYALAPRNFDLLFDPPNHSIPSTVSFLEKIVGETHDGEIILDLSHFSSLRL